MFRYAKLKIFALKKQVTKVVKIYDKYMIKIKLQNLQNGRGFIVLFLCKKYYKLNFKIFNNLN